MDAHIEMWRLSVEEQKELNIRQEVERIVEDICDNFCRYRCTVDDNGECDWIRDGEHRCPLFRLY